MNRRIELRYKNENGAVEFIIADNVQEYAVEMYKAHSKGWEFLGARLL